MDNYIIAETGNLSKQAHSKKNEHLYAKIRDDVYPRLRANPFFGINIKKLKGAYKHVYRFRVGNYRLFYTVEENQKIVFVIALESRQDSYK